MKVTRLRKNGNQFLITLSKEDCECEKLTVDLTLKDCKRKVKKGDLIKFDLGSKLINPNKQFANEYRVLKVEGDKAYVVSMYSLINMEFGLSQEYGGSDIDIFLENGFYPSISEEGKNAIESSFIKQDFYSSNTNKYSMSIYASIVNKYIKCIPCGQRHISLLCYNDILEYFEGKFSLQAIFKTFFKDQIHAAKHIFWLRSANSSDPNTCWRIGGYDGYINSLNYYYSEGVRPAFYIDLSKIKYEFVD